MPRCFCLGICSHLLTRLAPVIKYSLGMGETGELEMRTIGRTMADLAIWSPSADPPHDTSPKLTVQGPGEVALPTLPETLENAPAAVYAAPGGILGRVGDHPRVLPSLLTGEWQYSATLRPMVLYCDETGFHIAERTYVIRSDDSASKAYDEGVARLEAEREYIRSHLKHRPLLPDKPEVIRVKERPLSAMVKRRYKVKRPSDNRVFSNARKSSFASRLAVFNKLRKPD